jgi:hypothetical protein
MRHTTGPIAILSSQPDILDAPVPPGFWRKAGGFAIGLAVALVLNVLIGPRSAVWRSPASSRPAEPVRSVAAAAPEPAAAPSHLEAKPSPSAGSVADVPVADPPLREAVAHKASRSTKRHPAKHSAKHRATARH